MALLTFANGTPVIAKKLFGDTIAWPVDGDYRFVDGRPLFGRSKTIRGVVLAIPVTSGLAPVIGLPWNIGLVVGLMAMIGDLFSSFLKRRMNLAPSTMAFALDQVPESLFPMLACKPLIDITAVDIAVVTIAFLAGELILSRLLFKLHIRDRPF
jgi:hypothetical protein